MMPPFNNFTTKARDIIRRAHELAVERGQNHVSPMHLLTALVLDDEKSPILAPCSNFAKLLSNISTSRKGFVVATLVAFCPND